jgi:hypothetical protein
MCRIEYRSLFFTLAIYLSVSFQAGASTLTDSSSMMARDLQHIPLEVCHWPAPSSFVLHVNELSHHRFHESDFYAPHAAISFMPATAEAASLDQELALKYEARTPVSDRLIYVYQIELDWGVAPGEPVPGLSMEHYQAVVGDIVVRISGFTLPDVRAMVNECVRTWRER